MTDPTSTQPPAPAPGQRITPPPGLALGLIGSLAASIEHRLRVAPPPPDQMAQITAKIWEVRALLNEVFERVVAGVVSRTDVPPHEVN